MGIALLFALAKLAMQGLGWAHFRHFDTLHRERFPRHGSVLLVANHPAAWTDALVLDMALDRKLHFIAYERLFRPLARGWLLRVFGSLPVRFRGEAQAAVVNRQTFARCHEALDRAEVVAFFPEGVSTTDRTVGPLKTGAARLLAERLQDASLPLVIPVAIYYEDRTAFRGDVVVAVGAPMSYAALAGPTADPFETVRALTVDMASALDRTLHDASEHAVALATARRATMRAALERPRWGIRIVISSASGWAAGLGAILHAVPWFAVETGLRRMALPAQQVVLIRIGLGVLAFPLWYASLALLATLVLHLPWYSVLAVPLLGAATCRALDRRRARAEAQSSMSARGDS